MLGCCHGDSLVVMVMVMTTSSRLVLPAQDVVIYLVGDFAPVPLTVEGLGSVSVQELARDIRQALRIPETAQDAFALWLCSPLLGRTLAATTHGTDVVSHGGRVVWSATHSGPIVG